MRLRRTFPSKCSGLEISPNGKRLRQMSITESFPKAKTLKMDKLSDVSSNDSKSDSDLHWDNTSQFNTRAGGSSIRSFWWDEDTVPFSPNGLFEQTSQDNNGEVLPTNNVESALDAVSLHGNNSGESRPTGNDRGISKNEEKQKSAKTDTDLKSQNRKSGNSAGTADITNITSCSATTPKSSVVATSARGNGSDEKVTVLNVETVKWGLLSGDVSTIKDPKGRIETPQSKIEITGTLIPPESNGNTYTSRKPIVKATPTKWSGSPERGEALKWECDSDTSDTTLGPPSPPKRAKTVNRINKPSTSTPRTPKNTISSPVASDISTITPNVSSLSTESPQSDRSNETVIYDYCTDRNGCSDTALVSLAKNNGLVWADLDNGTEKVLMNYDESAMHTFLLQRDSCNESGLGTTQPVIKKSGAAKRLDYDNSTGSNNGTRKTEQKERIPKNNGTSKSNRQDQKSNDTRSTEDVAGATPERQRKRKVNAESNSDDRRTDGAVKENSSPKQSQSAPKAVIRSVVTIGSDSLPLRTTTNRMENLERNAGQITRDSERCATAPQSVGTPTTSAESNGLARNRNEGHTETKAKDSSNNDVSTKKKRLDGVIDNLLTRKGLPSREQPETNYVASNKIDVTTSPFKKTPIRPLATGWLGAKIKAQNTNASQTGGKINHPQSKLSDVGESQKYSASRPSSTQSDTSARVASAEVEKTPPRDTVGNQQPCCSKSLIEASACVKQNTSSTEQASNERAISEAGGNTSKSNSATPQKLKMGASTPIKGGSPRKNLLGSPSEGSPTKYREIKTLKSKEGRELHIRQMDELVKLFKVVLTNRHLKPLLNSNEHNILRKFVSMEDNKRYVVMKLFVWRRIWYNIFNFCTKAHIEVDDDKDIVDIFQYLREEEFVDTDYKTSTGLSELLQRLDVVKVKEIMLELNLRPIRSKKENVKTILLAASRQTTLTCARTFRDIIMDCIEKKLGFAIRIKEDVFNALYNVYLLATFANPEFYNIEDYFRKIIHLKVVFPETPVEAYPVFYSRDKFVNYGRALKMRAELEEQLTSKNKGTKFLGIYNIGAEAYGQLFSMDKDDADDHKEAPHLKRFTARHVYCGVLSVCCDHIFTKRNGRPSEVKKWLEYLIREFPTSRRLGSWYHKLIWLHMRHLDEIDYEKAANLLVEAFDTKKFVLGEIAKYELGALGLPLKSSKRHKIDQLFHDRVADVIPRPIDRRKFREVQIDSQCIRSEDPGQMRVYVKKSSEGMTVSRVEEVALKHYAENGYPKGEHCEGSLVKALLMLFFWDIIYNPTKAIAGTFISKLQSVPLDMFTPCFYKNRKELIDERLENIGSKWSEEKLIDFAASNWQNHSHEKAAYGMVMDTIKQQVMVEVLISVIGRKVLVKIFERIIKNMREFRSGMPDLLVWNAEERTCKFVEVKGEGDRLSTSQKLWLKYLQDIGASAEVCWVHSTGSKRKKIKKIAEKSGEQEGVPSENDERDNEAGPSHRPDD